MSPAAFGPLRFVAPDRLLLLAPMAGLAAAYVVAQRRRHRYVVRFTNLDLVDQVIPRHPLWRRHVPAAVLLAGMLVLTLALARPATAVAVDRPGGILVLAIDVSPSMMADDVPPTRFRAMVDAVKKSLPTIPVGISLGLVSFAGTAEVDVVPTTDHARVGQALDRLQFRSETSLTNAIDSSLSAIGVGQPEGRPLPAGVVLMSDGGSTVGAPLRLAIDQAVRSQVPVSTIAFGTAKGTIELAGKTIAVPTEPAELHQLASSTGGRTFTAASSDELAAVYRTVGQSVATVTEQRDVTMWFLAGGLGLSFLAACLALAWFSRLP